MGFGKDPPGRLKTTAAACAVLSVAASIGSLALSFKQIAPKMTAENPRASVTWSQEKIDQYCSTEVRKLVAPFELYAKLQYSGGETAVVSLSCPWQPANSGLRIAVDFFSVLFVPCLSCFIIRDGTSGPLLWRMKGLLLILMMAMFSSFSIDAQMVRIGGNSCWDSWEQSNDFRWSVQVKTLSNWTLTGYGCAVSILAVTCAVTFAHCMVLGLLFSVCQSLTLASGVGFQGTPHPCIPSSVLGQREDVPIGAEV